MEDVRPYEMMTILDPDLSNPDREGLVEKIKGLLEKHGATVEEIKEWGRRKMAYPIKKKQEGYYLLFHFQAPPRTPVDIRWEMRMTQGLLRYMVVRRDE